MKAVLIILVLLLMLSLFSVYDAYAQEPVIMEQVTNNAKAKVQMFWPEVLPDVLYNIELRFLNPQNNEPITDFIIIYDVLVMQSGNVIEKYINQRTEDGEASFEVMFPEEGIGSAEVTVVITAMEFENTRTDTNERAVFNVQVVPEFSALLAVVMFASMAVFLVLTKLNRSSILLSRI